MRHQLTRWAVLCVVVAGMGCGSDNGISTRYSLEKQVFDAHRLERLAYSTYPVDSYPDWRRAVRAYQEVLEHDTLRVQGNTAVSHDIERLFMEARVGLLRLYALDFRLHASVTYLPVDDRIDTLVARSWCEEAPHAARLYEALGDRTSLQRCVDLLEKINASPALWVDPSLMRDSLLVIPCQLTAPMCDTTGAAGRSRLAETFYSRIVETWPDSAAASVARRQRVKVRCRAGKYQGALEDLSALLAHKRGDEAELLLERGEILAFHLGRTEEGRRALEEVASRFPNHHSAWAARLDLALLLGDADHDLRELQLGPGVPDDVASRAMFARAALLEQRDERDQAFLVLWQLCGLYPDTHAALRAPLRIIRHYADFGETERSTRAFERACAFYADLLARGSYALKPRYLPLDCLIEACSTFGKPQRAVSLVEEQSKRWGGDVAAVAALKTALICLQILDSPEKADENLKKSLARFPRSRYLTTTYRVGDLVQSARDLDGVSDVPRRPR
jgi:tetratricopeptide (TPR) repeat protein